MSFTYVKIPADGSVDIEELSASKSGGLEHDALVASAKNYFQQQANAVNPPSGAEEYPPSCEIMALSIPLPGNNYRAVSLYASDYGVDGRQNDRATALVTACGHALPEPIRGDVFIGRAHDNEEFEWLRDNFTVDDSLATSSWCRVARASGGGGGQGGSASSLSNLVQSQFTAAAGKAPPQIVAPTHTTQLYGMDGAEPVKESWGVWTQSRDEVELKLVVPPTTKSKACKISFKRNQLNVAVPGVGDDSSTKKVEGTLFGTVIPDDCTYTLENVGGDGGRRELCITLAKADEGTTWSWLTTAAK